MRQQNFKYFFARILLTLFILQGVLLVVESTANAATNLTVTPITWNVIGLDSNNVNVGPNNFPIGVRVCNSGAATLVTGINFVWDDGGGMFTSSVGADPYINLRDSTLGTLYSLASPLSLAAGACSDAYFEVTVNRLSTAYNHTRNYHITATDAGGTASTPTPRQLFVEHLISQSRNSVLDVKLDGTSVPAGGTMNLMVGETYDITINGSTAPGGYNQLEQFINFPNTIFQVLTVNTSYTQPPSGASTTLYGDACGWENNPASPNYRSCVVSDDKVGANVDITYTVKILKVPTAPLLNPEPLSTLIYDFSGSSFHYNADYSVQTRYANIVNATVTKSFAPKAITPGGTAKLTFTVTNPGPTAITSVNFTDSFPGGLSVAGTPNLSYSAGCTGTPSPASLSSGQTSLSFSGITVAPFGTCTIALDVTAPAAGTYANTTGNLFINSTVDTGSTGSDTLLVSAAPTGGPTGCLVRTNLAQWSFTGNTNATLATGVTSATVTGTAAPTFAVPAYDSTIGNPAGAFSGLGWPIVSLGMTPTSAPYIEFTVDASKYGDIAIAGDYNMTPGNDWGGSNNYFVHFAADGSNFTSTQSNIKVTKGSWQNTFNYSPGLTTSSAQTKFRINAEGVGNATKQATAKFALDNIIISGCARPDPPTLSKNFSAATIAQGSTSTLAFTITNPNANTGNNYSLSGIAFTDVLPAGLTVADGTASVCGGTNNLTTTAATRTISLATTPALAAQGTCTFNVTVTGAVAGSYTNVSGNVSATESGPNTGANGHGTSTLTVVTPPTIAKTFGSTNVYTGSTTPLSFTLTNPGPTNMTAVAFSDSLPLGLTVATGSSSQCGGTVTTTHNLSPAQDTIVLTGGTLAAGGSCTFNVTVTGALAGSYTNTTGSVSGSASGVTVTGTTATANVLVRNQTPAIALQKQVGPSASGTWTDFLKVTAPEDIYFRLRIENTGDTTLNNIHINDLTLPGLNVSGCNISSLAQYAYQDCVVGPLTVSANGSYANTANAASDTAISANDTARYATAGILLTKSADKSSFTAAGEVLTYTYTVYNNSSSSLAGPVTVADNKAAVTCLAVNSVGNLDNNLDPGEGVTCTATYSVLAADVTAGLVTNTATATVNSVNSNTVSKTVYSSSTILADLTIAKTNGATSVNAGASTTYTIVVNNAGPSAANGAVFTDPAVANLSVTGVTCGSPTGGAACPTLPNTSVALMQGAGIVIPTLPSGGSITFSVTGTADTSGSIVNVATIATPAGTTDPDTSNNSATDTDTITAIADVTTTVTVPATASAGSTVSGTVTFANNGPSTADVSAYTFNITAGLGTVSFPTLPVGVTANYNNGSGVVTLTGMPATLTSGQTLSFDLSYTAPGGITPVVVNTAISTTTNQGTNTAPDSASGSTAISPIADLAISKTNSATSVTAGGTTTYTIRVTNGGPSSVTGAVLTDAAAAGLSKTAVACSGTPGQCLTPPTTGQLEGGAFALPLLASGQFYEISVTANVTAVGGSVSNTATVAAPVGTTDSNPANNSATDTDSVNSPNRPPSASNDSATTNYNTPVTLTILGNDVGGISNGAATNLVPATVTLSGTDLDPGTPGIQVLQGTWTINPASGNVTFTPANGFYGVVSIPYTVTDSASQLSNTALITVTVNAPAAPGTPEPPVANDNSATTAPITPVILLTLANDANGYDGNGVPTALDPATVDLDTGTAGVQNSLITAAGTWAVNTLNGNVTFTPAPGFTGVTSLPYTVRDNLNPTAQTSNPATLTVTVTGAATPAANPDAAVMKVTDPAVTVAVLGNDTASSGELLDPTTVDLDTTAPGIQNSKVTPEGSWTVDTAGLVTFTPAANYNGTGKPFTGTATLPYAVTDTAALTASSTITILVTPIAVHAVDDTAITPYLTPVTVPAPANDSAEAGATLEPATLVLDIDSVTPGIQPGKTLTVPGVGVWTVNANGSVTLAPAAGFSGDATVTYQISDSLGNVDTATITVTVGGQPPALACDVNGDGKINITDINLIFSARDTHVGLGDLRDLDGDGLITINDGRGCVLRCDNPKCAVAP